MPQFRSRFVELHLERGHKAVLLNVAHIVNVEHKELGSVVTMVSAGSVRLDVKESYSVVKAMLDPAPTEDQPSDETEKE